MYKTTTRKVLDYKILEEDLIISTDLGIVSIKLSKAENELQNFLPADGETPVGLVKFGDDPKWAKLKNTAFDMVDKLSSSEGTKYIDQAAAVNNTINSIVNMMRTEIEAVKLFK